MIITTLDIETAPTTAYTFNLFKANIGINQIIEPGYMLCFASKTHGKRPVEFYSTYADGKEQMVRQAHRIIDESDAIVHYNGTSFDMPHLYKEMSLIGLNPPSPVKEIDLLRVVRKKFRFESRKLDFVAQQFGLGHKVQHEGFGLWKAVMNDDPDAWRRFEKYCVGDVKLTEKLYDKLLPWIDGHPSVPLHGGLEGGCPNCGSMKVQKRGVSRTQVGTFERFQCQACGKWSRGGRSVGRSELR